jgi:hypothetical protein
MGARKRKQREQAIAARKKQIIAQARTAEAPLPVAELLTLGRSRLGDERAFAFIRMSDLLLDEFREEYGEFLDVAGPHLSDSDPAVRDFAMYVVGNFTQERSSEVWSYVRKHVQHMGKNSREDLGVNIVEELLHYEFDTYFPALQQEVAAGNRGLLDALSFSWFDDNKGPDYQRAQEYLASEGEQHALLKLEYRRSHSSSPCPNGCEGR